MGITMVTIYYCLAVAFIVTVVAGLRIRSAERREADLYVDWRRERGRALKYRGALEYLETILRPNQVYVSADPAKPAPGKRSREYIRAHILRTLKDAEIQNKKETRP